MPEIEIQLMGSLRVVVDGREVPLPQSRKARALLTMLALEPGDHLRSSLCAHIWPDAADPRGGLRWSLSKLRGVLGTESIVNSANGVKLDTGRVGTDVRRLEHMLDQAGEPCNVEMLRDHQARIASEPLADMDVCIGVEFDLWLESQRQALRRLQQRLLATLVEQLDDRPADALELARRRVALDPLNEAAGLDLLRLTLQVAGRQQAQAVLEQSRARLRDAGLPDAGLLAGWRRLFHQQPATPATVEVEPLPDMVWSPPQKPSVAVLGFEKLGEGDDGLLAEGLSVDLTSSLARLKGLFVIARASASRFRLADASAQDIGRQLGVRYLIHGSTRRLAGRLRVSVDLVECERGEQIWSEHFDRSLDDLFLVHDQIVDAIVSALEPEIEQAERERSRLLPTENLNAWECFHRAMWHTYRFTDADAQEAYRLLHRALQEDPSFARAHAGLSFTHFVRAFLHASEDVEGEVRQAVECARESVSLEPRDAIGHWSLGRALFLALSHDQALSAVDRALVINPNYAQGHYARGFIGCHSGLSREVYADLEMAQRLSPFDPLLFAMESCRAISLAVTGRPHEAVPWVVKSTQAPNAHVHIYTIAAACLQLAGQTEEAARNVRHVHEVRPGYRIPMFERSLPHKSDRDRRVMSDALVAAGMER
jgi:TolB-like protein/DNA-binding SARP family transcriptional activator